MSDKEKKPIPKGKHEGIYTMDYVFGGIPDDYIDNLKDSDLFDLVFNNTDIYMFHIKF